MLESGDPIVHFRDGPRHAKRKEARTGSLAKQQPSNLKHKNIIFYLSANINVISLTRSHVLFNVEGYKNIYKQDFR